LACLERALKGVTEHDRRVERPHRMSDHRWLVLGLPAAFLLVVFMTAAIPVAIVALSREERLAPPGSHLRRRLRAAAAPLLWVACNVSYLTIWGAVLGRSMNAVTSPEWTATLIGLGLVAWQPLALLLVARVLRRDHDEG
jgi:hypothetical protein